MKFVFWGALNVTTIHSLNVETWLAIGTRQKVREAPKHYDPSSAYFLEIMQVLEDLFCIKPLVKEYKRWTCKFACVWL